ncbi:putative RanGDP binding protein [Leishmania guyanensis]
MQTPNAAYAHAAHLRATLRAAQTSLSIFRRRRTEVLSVRCRWNHDCISRLFNARALHSPAEEDVLVRLLIQDAFKPASTASLSKGYSHAASDNEQSHCKAADTESKSCRFSQCETHATEDRSAGATLVADVERLGGGRLPTAGTAPCPGVPAHAQEGLKWSGISGLPLPVDESVAFVTDSRTHNAAAEPFATIRRGECGENVPRALEWLCAACRTYNSLTSSSATCHMCKASATISYRSAFPPLRHVAIMPTTWLCQHCSHTNDQASASAQPKTDRAIVAWRQRAKFMCDQCGAPFGGVQNWVCPTCGHFCPRAATQCPSCFAGRPLSWTCHCCECGVQNSIFSLKCRGCGHEQQQQFSNSVVRCPTCRDWNDVRWELCATCCAPLDALALARGKSPGSTEATLTTPPRSESAHVDTASMELAPDSAGMLHSKTVVKAAGLLQDVRPPGTATAAGGSLHDADDPTLLSPSPSSSPKHKNEEQLRVAAKLPDNAWWCYTCNVMHRRNVTFCDICLQPRDAMRVRSKSELTALRASSIFPTAEVASTTCSSDPATLKDGADVTVMPVTSEGDWQCPYCRKLLRVSQQECCGHRREVPYGYWLCDHCCSTNRHDRSVCLGCGEQQKHVCPWTCQECEWRNDATNVVCLQCGVPRAACTMADRGTPVSSSSDSSTTIACAVCGAPNHFEKSACYRCRARLRDVEWTCDACGHGHRTRNASRCEECGAMRQFDLREEVWLCEVCSTPVFSGGEIPVRTHCPKCNAQRALTATHYPSRWKCTCGLFNRSRVTECPECGARRRLESLDTTATCPRCFRDTPIDVRETCMYCSASLIDCFSRWESNITPLAKPVEAAEADAMPDYGDDDTITA